MNKSMYVILPALLAFSFLSGCATTEGQSKKLDKDVAAQPAESRDALRQESKQLIESSTELSAEQRTQLLEIRKAARTQIDAIRDNESKLQAILIKNVLSTKYDDREVDNIKARMRDNEKQRLAVIFDTVDKANKVLGRATVHDKEMMLNDVMDFHYPIHEL